MYRWFKRIVITAMIVGLLISNVLSLTSAAFSSLLSGVIAATTGIKTLSQLNREALDRQRMAVKRIGNRMVARTKRMITRTTVSTTVKWLPVLAVGLTIWDLSDYCDNLQDMDELYKDMDIEGEAEPLGICKAPDGP